MLVCLKSEANTEIQFDIKKIQYHANDNFCYTHMHLTYCSHVMYYIKTQKNCLGIL